MKVRTNDVKSYAQSILEFLGREKISSISDLLQREGERFLFGEGKRIEVLLRPSEQGTSACTLSYAIEGIGIPLEAKINQAIRYSKVMLKSIDEFEGYILYSYDRFGNVVQERVFEGDEFSFVRDEFVRLANL